MIKRVYFRAVHQHYVDVEVGEMSNRELKDWFADDNNMTSILTASELSGEPSDLYVQSIGKTPGPARLKAPYPDPPGKMP